MKLAIYGSTGSIGVNALKVLEGNSDKIDLVALSAHSNLELLASQAQKWQPEWLLISQEYNKEKAPLFDFFQGEILWGQSELATFASSSNCCSLLLAISGSNALPSAYAAAKTGKKLLLANKESLVAAGELIMRTAGQNNATVIPIDSEHNAIWQCMGMPSLPGRLNDSIESLEITASGGPFWNSGKEQMRHATVEEACNHPNWKMGAKISVDSATMVNKALELIEARWLYNISPDNLKVSVHPQSIIHGLVHHKNGSTLAQLSQPDMRIAISSALFNNNLANSGLKSISLANLCQLSFYPPDNTRFPALPLAYQAMQAGSERCLCFDISNEIANKAFRNKQIEFGSIVDCIAEALEVTTTVRLESIKAILERQKELAKITQDIIAKKLTHI